MSDNIRDALKYIQQMCGGEVTAKAKGKAELSMLPFAVVTNYKWYDAELLGISIVLAVAKNQEDCTPYVLQKHGQIASAKLGRHVVFVLSSVASYNLTRMTEARVNFIVPNKEMFIPSLLIELQKPAVNVVVEKETMPPIAQCMVIFHLLREPLDGKSPAELAKRFDVSYPNMSRALRWLESKGIIEQVGAKQKLIRFTCSGKELWDKALPLMESPIERFAYTDCNTIIGKAAGETALEHYTMMVAPMRQTIAISKQEAKNCKDILDKEFGDNIVEIWRYNPSLVTENEHIDKLSLYLSLRDNEDERIQMELETMIDNMQW